MPCYSIDSSKNDCENVNPPTDRDDGNAENHSDLQRRAFSDTEFRWLSSLVGVTLATAPTRAYYQLGLVEKSQQMVTESLMALWSQNPLKRSKQEALAVVVTGKT